MKPVPDPVDEILPQVVWRVIELLRPLLLCDGSDVIEGRVTVVAAKQTRHLAGGQEIVDVLEEPLLQWSAMQWWQWLKSWVIICEGSVSSK